MKSRNTSQRWQSTLPVWNSDNNNVLVCREIRQETHDVKSFFFSPQEESVFQFLPGQFITLELTIDGEVTNRSYTLSSSPTRPHVISITVKRKPDGIVSNWLHDHMKVGMAISALGPTGDFTCVLHPAKKYLFLSGGSGITPLMSMARSFHDLAEDADLIFMHSARSPMDIIFKKELDLMTFNQTHFQPKFICASIDKSATPDSQPEWLIEGMLTAETLKRAAPDFLEREVFTCGPAPYMASVRNLLAAAGFAMEHYHEESFTFDELPAAVQSSAQPVESVTQSNGNTFSVTLTKSEATVQCAPDQFILDAARNAGLRLPSSCSKGLCGTCKSKLISGQVDMKHGGGIRQREIDQGLFLPCCSTPLSDLVIER
jgi:ferredoxin-NADP reductase